MLHCYVSLSCTPSTFSVQYIHCHVLDLYHPCHLVCLTYYVCHVLDLYHPCHLVCLTYYQFMYAQELNVKTNTTFVHCAAICFVNHPRRDLASVANACYTWTQLEKYKILGQGTALTFPNPQCFQGTSVFPTKADTSIVACLWKDLTCEAAAWLHLATRLATATNLMLGNKKGSLFVHLGFGNST